MINLRRFELEDSLADAREKLLLFLTCDSSIEGEVTRGGLNLSERCLIDANVIVKGKVEVWYELHAQRSIDAGDHVMFMMRAVSPAALPATARLIILFGKVQHEVAFVDGTAEHTWRCHEREVIDRKNRRVSGPTDIKLDGL